MTLKELFATRFKSARLMSGLSLQKLEDKIGKKVTRQALHKYEQGKVLPDSEMIILLGNALNVRPDYFFKKTEVKVELGEIRYFKISKY